MHRLNSLAALACCLMTLVSSQLVARDNGRFANSPLKEWFDRLASRNGLCCAFADGVSVQDVDWDTEEGHYHIRRNGRCRATQRLGRNGWARLRRPRQAPPTIVPELRQRSNSL